MKCKDIQFGSSFFSLISYLKGSVEKCISDDLRSKYKLFQYSSTLAHRMVFRNETMTCIYFKWLITALNEYLVALH